MATSNRPLCSPCGSRATSIAALKYCKTCQEPLCKNCSELHKAFKATKNHVLVGSGEQPVMNITSNLGFQMCTEHPNKQTEFYCFDHSLLLCYLCLLKSDAHNKCSKVVEIDIVGKAFIDSQFMDTVTHTCRNIAKSYENTKTEIRKANKCTSDSLKGLRCEIENIRSKMLQAFDRQTDYIIQSVSGDVLGNIGQCEQAIKNLGNLKKTFTEKESLLKSAVENGATADVFRGVMTILKQFGGFEREMEKTKRHCLVQRVNFKKSDLVDMLETDQNPLLFCNVENVRLELPYVRANRLIEEFKQCIAEIPNDIVQKDVERIRLCVGTVQSKSRKERVPSSLMNDLEPSSSDAEIVAAMSESTIFQKNPTYLDIEVDYRASFDVELSDEEVPWFGGLVCLPDESLVLSDYNNSRMIMVRDNTVVTKKDVEFIPGNLTHFNKYLVVCLMKTNKLLQVEIGKNSLKEYRYLRTRYHPKCVHKVDNERILVSSKKGYDKWCLELMKLQEQNWLSTEIDVELCGIYDGYKLAVQHVPGQNDSFRIIQSCEISGKLQCFHEAGGSSIFDYEVDDTTSVATDHLGYIFIVRYPGEVQVLSPEGTFITSIQRNAMQRLKFSAFNKSMDKLFITTYKDSRIHVLNIRRENFVK